MELRIIAEFANDPLWDQVFLEDGDLHSVLCCKVFNIGLDQVKDPFPLKPDLKYRDVQKTLNFGISYGMSRFKLADTLDITDNAAQVIIDDFFAVVPRVKGFLTLLGNMGKSRGFIRSAPPYRRVRWFPKWDPDYMDDIVLGEIERASKNMPIQGSNADVIKLALCTVQDYIEKHNCPVQIKLSIYDEIQTECREDFAEEWKITLERLMIECAETIIKRIPIKVDVSINDFWCK